MARVENLINADIDLVAIRGVLGTAGNFVVAVPAARPPVHSGVQTVDAGPDAGTGCAVKRISSRHVIHQFLAKSRSINLGTKWVPRAAWNNDGVGAIRSGGGAIQPSENAQILQGPRVGLTISGSFRSAGIPRSIDNWRDRCRKRRRLGYRGRNRTVVSVIPIRKITKDSIPGAVRQDRRIDGFFDESS